MLRRLPVLVDILGSVVVDVLRDAVPTIETPSS